MSEVIVLDVGHGNATVIRDGDDTVVVDAPLREHLVDALRMEGVNRVRLAVASHSDSDHCGGFIGLLLAPDIIVEELRMNPDATRETRKVRREFWGDLKTAWKRAHEMHGTKLRIELTDHVTEDISTASLRLEVLYPSAELALGGVGSLGSNGKTVSPNAMSAVIRVVLQGVPLVLLPGDLDSAGLDYLVAAGSELTANALVFPHHGGLPEGAKSDHSSADFVTRLMGACRPSTVLFSIGRGAHATPQPSVVSAVRATDNSVHIACTQLSKRCSEDLLAGPQHLGARYSAGRESGACCLGSAVLTPADGLEAPSRTSHEQAVTLLPNRLCQ